MNTGFKYIDLGYLVRSTDGDRALQKTMLGTLVRELPVELARLRTLLAAGDWNGLGMVSHRLRTTLAFAGNASMIDIVTEMERIAGDGAGRERLPELLAGLEALAPGVLRELQTAADTL
jgi:HPt (histidine-containing phosphotransfer) domain-containing protein